jgi:nicotinamide-nucleotide amidase
MYARPLFDRVDWIFVDISNEILGLVSEIHGSLRARGETLSTAESLTAGGLSYALTIVPGASDVFLGSITAYRPEVKVSHLKVEEGIIAQHSVVSEEVAIQMGHGANESFGSTWSIATTGVAGPGPADGSEAGKVFVAFVGPITQVMELSLSGEREVIRNATIASAIASFARILRHRDKE